MRNEELPCGECAHRISLTVNSQLRQFGIKENALLRQTAEGAWGKAPKNFIKKKNIKKQVKI